MNIQELKLKSSEQLITQAEELGIENASTLRKQEILFAILKKVADKEDITGAGVLQLLQDGFGFLRAMESNYLPGPDDIYVSPSQIRKFGLRTGDTVEGPIRAPKDGERYFALLQVNKINFDEPEKVKNKVDGKVVKMDHLTPKPLEMIERIVKASSNKGDIVLDCFVGSGTTAVAAKKLNRRYLASDSNSEFVKITRKRIKKLNI